MCKVVTRILKNYQFFHHYNFLPPNSNRLISLSNILEEKVTEPFGQAKPLDQSESVPSDESCNKKPKATKNSAVNYLKQTLEINTWDATQITNKFKRITQVSPKLLSINYNICVKNGINHDTILKYPLVLSETNLQEKINELRKLPKDLNQLVPLTNLSVDKVRLFVQNDLSMDRTALLCKIFKVTESAVLEMMQNRPFLISFDLKRIQKCINILSGYGISTGEILKDLWVLRYSPEVVTQRLDIAQQNNIENFKTWMIRCPELTLDRYIKRRSDNKIILGNNSLIEYLSKRLECSENEVKYMITKHPALQSKSVSKINQMISFLFSYGFKPSQIKRSPKILLHSVETTKKRLSELENHGAVLEHLSILTKSQKQYLQHFETLKPSKNKTQKCRYDNT